MSLAIFENWYKQDNLEQLSKRELEVLELIVEGYSNPDIAKQLNLSTNNIPNKVEGGFNFPSLSVVVN